MWRRCASGPRYDCALEPFLRRGALCGGSRPGDPAAMANARTPQRQRQRLSFDRSAGEGGSAPGRFQGHHGPGGSRFPCDELIG